MGADEDEIPLLEGISSSFKINFRFGHRHREDKSKIYVYPNSERDQGKC
jgi:hypothetical protein